MRSSSDPTLLASRLWYCWKTTRSSDPIIGSIWSRMHKEIWGSVFLTWSRKIWKAEDFHAFPCGIFTFTSAQMLNPILRKEKVLSKIWPKILTGFGWTVENHSVTYLQPFFVTGKDAPTGGAFADFGTGTENKTSQDVFCEPNVRIKLRRIVGVNLQRSWGILWRKTIYSC